MQRSYLKVLIHQWTNAWAVW